MRKTLNALALCALLMLLPASSLAAARALLVACSEFVSQPDLGSAISGNLHMIGSAFLGVSPRLDGLSIEDGTIGTPDALSAAVNDAFGKAAEDDLSILYLCTHGISSSDDGASYLLLGDGQTESALTAEALCGMLRAIPGEKVLILDACFSGALIGRQPLPVPGEAERPAASPFLADPSIHVLTSADGHESSWYYDSMQLSTGAVSYFASALASGLGLYGTAEADVDGDGMVTLAEIHRYLSVAVPSSGSQLLSVNAEGIALPAVKHPSISRPLSGFSYGESLLTAGDAALDFSFTVTRETAVQYRLIDFDAGRWNWEQAKTFLDGGDAETGLLTPGRKTRTLALSDIAPQDSGYLMLQIFALEGDALTLCSERLIAVQPEETDTALTLHSAPAFSPDEEELAIGVYLRVPAEITVSVHDGEGQLVRRLCRGQLTRPTPGDMTYVHWDGRDESGLPAPRGAYTVTVEAHVSGTRQKAAANVVLE